MKIDQNVIDEYQKLHHLRNYACVMNPTGSRIEHDAFVEEARKVIAPGSLGMISDDYKFICRGRIEFWPPRTEKITEITMQGSAYFALSYVPGECGGPWIGNAVNGLQVFSDEDIGKRVRELTEYFKNEHYTIVTSRNYRKKRKSF